MHLAGRIVGEGSMDGQDVRMVELAHGEDFILNGGIRVLSLIETKHVFFYIWTILYRYDVIVNFGLVHSEALDGDMLCAWFVDGQVNSSDAIVAGGQLVPQIIFFYVFCVAKHIAADRIINYVNPGKVALRDKPKLFAVSLILIKTYIYLCMFIVYRMISLFIGGCNGVQSVSKSNPKQRTSD